MYSKRFRVRRATLP